MAKSGKNITLVAAMANNRAIGFNGQMPWHLPEELRHFKQVTMGKAIIMGRKTWQSIGRPLPSRQNIVVTRNPAFQADGCDVANSLQQAIELANNDEVMVIGGGELYRQAFPLAHRLVLTRVDCEPQADTWFPQWNEQEWTLVEQREMTADEGNPYAYTVQDLRRN